METETKVCKCCGRELSLDHFKRGRYGYVSVCLDCDKSTVPKNVSNALRSRKRKLRICEPKTASCAFLILPRGNLWKNLHQGAIVES